MSEKEAKIQRKTLKDLQKAWKTIVQDHFKRLPESLTPFKETQRCQAAQSDHSTL